MAKHSFNPKERYAIWANHGWSCWDCGVPLFYKDLEIDHFFPECFLSERYAEKREKAYREFEVHDDFQINWFENWLPSCSECNRAKADYAPDPTKRNKKIFKRLKERAYNTSKTADDVQSNRSVETILNGIFSAISRQVLSIDDLIGFCQTIAEDPTEYGAKEGSLFLDGILFGPEKVRRKCLCKCGRQTCTGRQERVMCYFHDGLSDWIVNTGLYWQCYDEIVECPRCAQHHKRGHIGSDRFCGSPFNASE